MISIKSAAVACCTAAAVLAMGITCNAAQKPKVENMLADLNPGFEQPAVNGKIPGWAKSDWGQANIVSDIKHEGKSCVWLSDNVLLTSDKTIKVEPGYTYHMSAWGKLKDFKFISSGRYGVGFGLRQFAANGDTDGNWYDMQTYLVYKEGDIDWTSIQFNLIPKETTAYLKPVIMVQSDGGSQVWFDDVKVWREKKPDQSVSSTLNIIENGSFEVFYGAGNGGKANGYLVKAPKGQDRVYDSHMYVTNEDKAYNGIASLKMTGECAMVSTAGYTDANKATAQIAIKTKDMQGKGAYAKLLFFDKNRKQLGAMDVATSKGTNDWKLFSVDLNKQLKGVRYIQWQFGVAPGSKGEVWFDNLKVNVPSLLAPLPYRQKNTQQANVTVDCSAKKGEFTSPLNGYDHHRSDRLYSPTIRTAGPQLEGPNRWFESRLHLGFKYVRIHEIYYSQYMCAMHNENGIWKIRFDAPRKYYPDNGKTAPEIYTVDKDGNPHYDFSTIKYLLDNVVVKYGCKPIIDLAFVPPALEKDRHGKTGGYFIPKDYKKWEDMNYQFIKFLVDTYGKDEVLTWMFETANEPSTIWTFCGDPDNVDTIMDDFIKFQDYTVAGVTRALPGAFIAGPSGPPESWIEPMLNHCATGVNYATGKIGTKIDAISCHGYLGATTTAVAWRQQEDQLLRYQGYINRYYQKTGKKLQLFNTEYSPLFHEATPELSSLTHERNNHIQAVATLHMGNYSHKQGVTSMEFFFHHPIYQAFYNNVPSDKTPEFTGISTCTTVNGVFTPVCRAYEMMSMLNGSTEVSAQADVEPIYSLATSNSKQIKVLCYSFDADTHSNYTTNVNISINPAGVGNKFKVTRYDLSATKANSWYLAQKMNLMQADCEKDMSIVDKINADSEFKPEEAGTCGLTNGKIDFKIDMPAYSASLLVFDKID